MTNYVSSVIRTWVPIIIGTAVAWLSAHAGFVLDESSQAGLIAATTGSAIGIYYAVVRWAEQKFPQIGWLLGLAKPPTYESDA